MDNFTPIVHRYTTYGMKMVVNVFMVETENGVVLIDAATAISSSTHIRDSIAENIKKPLHAILLTHGHPDHYIGAGEIAKDQNIPIVSTIGTYNFARFQDEYKLDTLKKGYRDNFPENRRFPDQIVKNGDELMFDNIVFKVIDYGPCESDSDAVWELNINGVRHVFVGDLIYNKRHSYFRDGHALNWIKTLDNMLIQYNHQVVFHPGHGDDCGAEIIIWQKAYIEAFLYTLRSLLNNKKNIGRQEQEILFDRMKSFLPDETIIFLLKYEPDETIKALRDHGAI